MYLHSASSELIRTILVSKFDLAAYSMYKQFSYVHLKVQRKSQPSMIFMKFAHQ